ncbi:hypothetical protein GCM10011575_24920 [Microlunatus endophyticus]|uniref:DUF218 domain-containing protein n=1 Tax=Microlunatus endophyticus TaxID=1716077 RepID=A0A917S9Q2_9ACTN|nr:hypothetical protein GCM10011575_24920 [Microlunatus endophyticus]
MLAAGAGVAPAVPSVLYIRRLASGHIYPVDRVPGTPVGIVFGALTYADGTPSSFLRGRLDLGLELLRRKKIDSILVSGDHDAEFYDETAAMRDYLVDHGVPANRIIVDPYGFDTYDTVVRARDVYGAVAATMITQSYHLPRAVATARAVGLDAVGVGDTSVRVRRIAWTKGLIRDQLACVKTVYDLATKRRPMQEGSARLPDRVAPLTAD